MVGNVLQDKFMLLAFCTVVYIQKATDLYAVVPVICALAAAAYAGYTDREPVKLAVFLIYCTLCLFYPNLIYFLPLVCYDLWSLRRRYLVCAALIPISTAWLNLSAAICLSLIFLITLSWLIHRRSCRLEKLEQEYISLRNSAKEFSLQLEHKNKELLEKQDYEIHLATLNERNRIARDIHDNIGHLLSNSLLQTGALMATCQDQALYPKLETLKNTLSQGMNSIRESIHDLHDESVDLYTEVAGLVQAFQFCQISLDYDLESNPPKNVKYALLAVLKEALSNISKHSNATAARVTLREHPALYQLIIKDNGTQKDAGGEGIGLKSIAQRVGALRGNVHIGESGGFTVFISLPKENHQ